MLNTELRSLDILVDLALREDLGDLGDITSLVTIPKSLQGEAVFVAREAGVLAGLDAARQVATRLDVTFGTQAKDGDTLQPGDMIAFFSGSMRAILMAERTALNFMQRLSGIATLTNQFVDLIAGTKAKIVDTRKTTPGWRRIEKYAVRVGGGTNHRVGLFDGILIKDNHLAALGEKGGDIWATLAQELQKARQNYPQIPIEIEVDSLEQLHHVWALQPNMVLLDNMKPDLLKQAVAERDAQAPKILLEASGGVNLQTVRAIAETGVDRISIGALTHSARSLDIALDYVG